MQALLKQGYRVYPVNPREVGKQILGQDCYADLETLNGALDQPVDMVEIFRSSEAAFGVTQEAIAIKAKVVWMQLEIINHQAAELAEAEGIKVVMNRCPKIELEKPYWTGIAG
jgi:predicted CoA-binding protein